MQKLHKIFLHMLLFQSLFEKKITTCIFLGGGGPLLADSSANKAFFFIDVLPIGKALKNIIVADMSETFCYP